MSAFHRTWASELVTGELPRSLPPDAPPAECRKGGSSFGKQIKPEHKRMSRILGYTLTLGDTEAWSGFCLLASARLTVAERAALAFMALKSLNREDARETAEAALAGIGAPITPLFDHFDEAMHWADFAEADQIEAYCMATFNRMSPDRQAEFLRHVQRRAA